MPKVVLKKVVTPLSIHIWIKRNAEHLMDTYGAPVPIIIRSKSGDSIAGMVMMEWLYRRGFFNKVTLMVYNAEAKKQISCSDNFDLSQLKIADKVYLSIDPNTEVDESLAEVFRPFV